MGGVYCVAERMGDLLQMVHINSRMKLVLVSMGGQRDTSVMGGRAYLQPDGKAGHIYSQMGWRYVYSEI